jgi:DNA-binding IclR family transcriptional regulator
MAGGSTEWRGRSVISKVVALLDAFTPAAPELTLGELARRTGLPVSTTYRLVSELVAWGGLERLPGGGYRIGVRMREIGSLASPHDAPLPT